MDGGRSGDNCAKISSNFCRGFKFLVSWSDCLGVYIEIIEGCCAGGECFVRRGVLNDSLDEVWIDRNSGQSEDRCVGGSWWGIGKN